MVLTAEDFERLKKNVHAMNTGAARLGEQVHKAHERQESPVMERAEHTSAKTGTDLYKRFYGKKQP